jgi:hypothetical protein
VQEVTVSGTDVRGTVEPGDLQSLFARDVDVRKHCATSIQFGLLYG